MSPKQISAVVLTKGGYNLDEIVDSLRAAGFEQVILADNSKRTVDRKVYTRYLGAVHARNNIVMTQDDDCIVDAKALVDQYSEHMCEMMCNMPKDRRAEYARRPGHISLVGWGAIFNVDIVSWNLMRFLAKYPADELFDRECDRVATYLTPHIDVEVPFRHLDRALGEDRMGREARHGDDLKEICKRLEAL